MAEDNILVDIAIPILVGVFGLIGALIGVFWGEIQAWNRRRIFEKLILREIEELSPHPLLGKDEDTIKDVWTERLPHKKFVHPDIFNSVTENRDFIFSLNPNLVYFVTQLWDEVMNQKKQYYPDESQFHYFLDMIILYARGRKLRKRYSGTKKLEKVHNGWVQIFNASSDGFIASPDCQLKEHESFLQKYFGAS